MNKLKELTEQINAEIRANFESGNYEIVRQNSIFYMIKMEGIEAEIYTIGHSYNVELHQPLGGIVKYSLAAFDLYEEARKAARIAELEKELKEVQNG